MILLMIGYGSSGSSSARHPGEESTRTLLLKVVKEGVLEML